MMLNSVETGLLIEERRRREEEAERAREMTPEYRAATLAKVQAMLNPKKMDGS